jgi:uncharacterized protein YjbI with pentapeptide repeats
VNQSLEPTPERHRASRRASEDEEIGLASRDESPVGVHIKNVARSISYINTFAVVGLGIFGLALSIIALIVDSGKFTSELPHSALLTTTLALTGYAGGYLFGRGGPVNLWSPKKKPQESAGIIGKAATGKVAAAVKLLIAPEPLTRLTGIFTLESVGHQDVSSRAVVVDIIAMFLKIFNVIPKDERPGAQPGLPVGTQEAMMALSRLNTGDVRIDLRGADLADADLSGLNLSRANLEKAVLSRCDLSFTDFTAANLRLAQLDNCRALEANFTGAVLHGADLTKSVLASANLTGALMIFARLRGVFAANANLSMALLGEADLSFADLRKANLKDAFLVGANMEETNLEGAFNFAPSVVAGKSPTREFL